MIKKIKYLLFGVLLLGSFVLTSNFANAQNASCNGKPADVSCTVGDGHSFETGKCDGKGNCITSGPLQPVDDSGSDGQMKNKMVPGTTVGESEFIKCGRPGQRMCELCDLIAGLNDIIQYIMKISIGLGILAFTLAGVTYIISGGGKLMETAKAMMKNAAIGFVIIFGAWLMVNTTIELLGSKSSNGKANFGMNIVSWGKFDCTANSNR